MSQISDFINNEQFREFACRAEANADRREVLGVGVPLADEVEIWPGFRESFDQDCEFVGIERAKLMYRHSEPIGVITESKREKGRLSIVGRASKTARADEALELTRDGALDSFSIGFRPVEWVESRDAKTGTVTIRHTKVKVREFSLVPQPAYENATVTGTRALQTEPERTPTMDPITATPGTVTPDDVREIRESVADIERAVALIGEQRDADTAAETDTRSAGEWLRALAAGDEDSVRAYEEMVERAYAGGTSADGILTPQYVGDTIRLFNVPDPLGDIFSTGVLPSKGLKLEYGVMKEDTIDVDEQVNEGDDLVTGGISVGVEHADIHTYGGYIDMTRQKIERTTNVNILDLGLRSLALRGARRKSAVLRKHYADLVTVNATKADRTVVVTDQTKHLDWVKGIIDAAELFIDQGLSLDALVVDKTVFQTLAGLSTETRPLMRVFGDGPGQVGEIGVKALGGNLVGIPVRVNLKQAAAGAAFVHGAAIRQYASPVTELADENIVNLSKQFGLYYYAANATEIPFGVVPVVASKPAAAPEGE